MLIYSYILLIMGVSPKISLCASLVEDFCTDLVKSQIIILFRCSELELSELHSLYAKNQRVLSVNVQLEYSITKALTRHNFARTCIVLDCGCNEAPKFISEASSNNYFNKTYEWLLLDTHNKGLHWLLENVNDFGPNAQVMYVNRSSSHNFGFFDVHSKGRHLNASLECNYFGDWNGTNGFLLLNSSIAEIRGSLHRTNFYGLKLRGVAVIDRDYVDMNIIDQLLSNPRKSDGISPFVKYHYLLVEILKHMYNFTVNYRITRGWAGRLSSGYRLGLLGVVQRNEADIVASGAFNRKNRFAEFDIIHQGWIFADGFLFRASPDLATSSFFSGKAFLAPFQNRVWFLFGSALFISTIIWKGLIQFRQNYISEMQVCEQSVSLLFLLAIAAVGQQGMESISNSTASRIIAITLTIFSLLMYNYYTSSVVGGLLSSKYQGPRTVEEIANSPLMVSFEDYGYHKLVFMESNSSAVKKLYEKKVLPKRGPGSLPVYTQLEKAIPYLKKGGYAFHCEVVDAYPEIERAFDQNEICELQSVFGLLETEVLNMILTKRSIYTELFRIGLKKVREVGIVYRELKNHRPQKPTCFSAPTLHPVPFIAIFNAHLLLGAGAILALVILLLELLWSYKCRRNLGS